ncbi:MAG: glycosyl hydrolase 53 family protein [Eubacterium sp.]
MLKKFQVAKRIVSILLAITMVITSISLDVTITYGLELSSEPAGDISEDTSGEDFNLGVTSGEETPYNSDLYVEKVDNLSEDFIMGVDISSVIALENSGVVWTNQDGEEEDFFEILADSGVNWVRVRIWNDPYYTDDDGNKHGYGGGNCDLDCALAIGKRATSAGLSVLLDFHYSDFWAHPGVQTVPKAWSSYSLTNKSSAIYDYTTECLEAMEDEGVNVGMVQVGNETTSNFCGVSSWSQMATLFSSGCKAVSDFNDANGTNILTAIHFTNPHRTSAIKSMADSLNQYNVDYDVFATSYYPFWHGTLDNLLNVLDYVADTYDKYTMVAEFSWANTLADADSHSNSVSSASVLSKYQVSQQGQAIALQEVVKTINSVSNGKGLGVFYWEPAWIKTGLGIYTKRSDAWSEYGTGWASKYAQYYTGYGNLDDVTNYYGGSSWDNMAMFSQTGQALEVLNTFKYLYKGTDAELTISSYDDPSFSVEIGEDIVMPQTISVTYTIQYTCDENITWDSSQVSAIDTSVEGIYTIDGYLTDDVNKTVQCTITVYENTIISVEDTIAATALGEEVQYPTEVGMTYKNGTSGKTSVTWNADEQALVDVNTAGSYEVTGTLDEYDGFVAKLTVVVCGDNLVVNGDFETSDVTSGKSRNVPSWTTYSSVATADTWPVYTETKSSYPTGAGSRCITFWTSSYSNYEAKYYQTIDISDYGAGYYLISVYAMTDISSGLYLYAASGDSESEITAQQSINVSGSYAKNSMIVSITDTDNLTVGVYDNSVASGAWANMDKFEVYYIGIDENAQLCTSLNYYYSGSNRPAIVYDTPIDGINCDFTIDGKYGYYMTESDEGEGWYSIDVYTQNGGFALYDITAYYNASGTAEGNLLCDFGLEGTADGESNYNLLFFKGLNYICSGEFFKDFETAVGTKDYLIEIGEISHGVISVDSMTARYKDVVSVTAIPDDGYELQNIYVNGTAVEGTEFLMPAGDVIITAEFVKTDYAITTTNSLYGMIDVVSTANYGDIVTVTVYPNDGYKFDYITVNGEVIEGTSFEMPNQEVTISAFYSAIEYSIDTNSVNEASITANAENATIGTLVSFSIEANAGYTLDEDSIKVYDANDNEVAYTLNGSVYMFNMPASNVYIVCTCTAIDYEITYKSVSGGSVVADKETANVGDEITITALPDEGYYLSELKVRYKSSIIYVDTIKINATTYTFTMPAANMYIIPTFSEKTEHSLSIDYSAGGIAYLSSYTAAVTDVVTITAIPDEGYQLKGISIITEDGEENIPADSFEMPDKDVNVYVEFEAKATYEVICETSSNGSISTDKTEYYEGDTVSVNSYADAGYKLGTIFVNNEAINGTSFVMPAGVVNISAEFIVDEEQKFAISIGTIKNGTIGTDKQIAFVGATVTVTAVPDEGYEFISLSMDGVLLDGFSFIMPAREVVLTAVFSAVNYSITTVTPNNGKLSVNKNSAHINDAVIATAVANTGYKLEGIYVNGTKISGTTFTMPAGNVVVTAKFSKVEVKKTPMKKGTVFTSRNIKYVVIKSTSTGGNIAVKGLVKKKVASVKIPATVKKDGFTYKVTSIASKAFYKNKTLKKVTISSNIRTIGKKAFYGCKKLNNIIIKTKKLSKVGSSAFRKISSKARVRLKRTVFKKYKKLLIKRGMKKTVTFKKI